MTECGTQASSKATAAAAAIVLVCQRSSRFLNTTHSSHRTARIGTDWTEEKPHHVLFDPRVTPCDLWCHFSQKKKNMYIYLQNVQKKNTIESYSREKFVSCQCWKEPLLSNAVSVWPCSVCYQSGFLSDNPVGASVRLCEAGERQVWVRGTFTPGLF